MPRILLIIKFLVFSFVLSCAVSLSGQNSSITNRTPEQEARKQTEKMEKELDLTPEQREKIYELNLKYAKERKESNSRIDAMERIRKKDEELKKILNSTQYRSLASKRTNVNSVEINGKRRYSDSNYSRSFSKSSKKNGINYSSPKNSTIRKRSTRGSNVNSSGRSQGNRPVRFTNPKASTEVQRRSRTNVYGNRPVRSSNVDRNSTSLNRINKTRSASNNRSSKVNSRQSSLNSRSSQSTSSQFNAASNSRNSGISSNSRK